MGGTAPNALKEIEYMKQRSIMGVSNVSTYFLIRATQAAERPHKKVWFLVHRFMEQYEGSIEIMKVGYVRISTKEQNTARQDVLMEQLGAERVYTDKVSGKDTKRPELQKMMEFVREGDVVIVESISRLARSTKDLLELISRLEEKKVQFISRKETIDTSTPTGKFMLAVFAALAQLERETTLERQAEGIAIAKAEGRMTGRPKKVLKDFDAIYEDVKSGKISASKGAKKLGISRSTWYRKVKALEKEYIDF